MEIQMEGLENNKEIHVRINEFHKSIDEIANIIKLCTDTELYSKLSNVQKIKYNLLLSFGLNSMFWMSLRAEGIDPMKHKLKSQGDRLKKYMDRSRQIHDKKTIMPRVNKNVVKSFVRNSLWEPNSSNAVTKNFVNETQ